MQEQKVQNLYELQIAGLLFAKPSIPASAAFHLIYLACTGGAKTVLFVSQSPVFVHPVTHAVTPLRFAQEQTYCAPACSYTPTLWINHKKAPPDSARRDLFNASRCYATFMPLWVSIKCCTTPGSASVEISPSPSYSPVAILRKMRRMILPERVLGRPGAH